MQVFAAIIHFTQNDSTDFDGSSLFKLILLI